MIHMVIALAGAGGGFSWFGVIAGLLLATAGVALELSRRRR
jgi:hypothetical protein